MPNSIVLLAEEVIAAVVIRRIPVLDCSISRFVKLLLVTLFSLVTLGWYICLDGIQIFTECSAKL